MTEQESTQVPNLRVIRKFVAVRNAIIRLSAVAALEFQPVSDRLGELTIHLDGDSEKCLSVSGVSFAELTNIANSLTPGQRWHVDSPLPGRLGQVVVTADE